MNAVMTFLDIFGWMVVVAFLAAAAYLLWHTYQEVTAPDAPTDPFLPKCDECGWVEGTNTDCDTCVRAGKR